MIKLSNVSHQIDDAGILSDITLDIPDRGITAIVGPNGAGKSTLLNLIARQIDLQTGDIVIDGLPLQSTLTKTLALKMALVSQHVGVASRLRVHELIEFGRWPHSRGKLTKRDYEIVDQAIQQFTLTELKNRFLDQLSGGQRQRAFIAMAFAQSTDWILLDEPLSSLDMFHARSLMIELKRLATEYSKSIIMVVHDLNYAAKWANNCVGMKNGRVCFSGQTSDVLTESNIEKIFDLPVSRREIDGKPIILHY